MGERTVNVLREMDEDWAADRDANGWVLPPPAPRFWRLPVIRHLRATYHKIRVERWYRHGPGSIGLRTGYDEWVIYAILRGWV